jgi:hypothetical protein
MSQRGLNIVATLSQNQKGGALADSQSILPHRVLWGFLYLGFLFRGSGDFHLHMKAPSPQVTSVPTAGISCIPTCHTNIPVQGYSCR